MTDLLWDGKYDAHGRRVAPVRVALPFQTVETVNESAQQRQRALDRFAAGRDPAWRNRPQSLPVHALQRGRCLSPCMPLPSRVW